MKLSPITKAQMRKIAKTAVYLAISSAIGGVLALIAQDPDVFGPATIVINIVLVALKQAFTEG